MKLTDEQIAELAPDWATHYSHNSKTLTFSSAKKAVVTDFKGIYLCSEHDNDVGFTAEDKPIQRKRFDISEYEFSDDKLSLLISDADLISLNDNCSNSCFDLFKEDIIAMAKHFNLTAEDLK